MNLISRQTRVHALDAQTQSINQPGNQSINQTNDQRRVMRVDPKAAFNQRIGSVFIMSSLSLAIILSINALFSFICILVIPFVLRFKFIHNADRYRSGSVDYIDPILFTIWSLIECLRLYVGYVGNVKERIELLISFLFITLVIQMPFVVYFSAFQLPLFGLDRGLMGTMIAFLCIEIILGYRALNRIMKATRAKFRIEFSQSINQSNNQSSIHPSNETNSGLGDLRREIATQTDADADEKIQVNQTFISNLSSNQTITQSSSQSITQPYSQAINQPIQVSASSLYPVNEAQLLLDKPVDFSPRTSSDSGMYYQRMHDD